MVLSKCIRLFFITMLLVCSSVVLADSQWFQKKDDSVIIDVYFFWSERCPHCLKALPFFQQLGNEENIRLHAYQLIGNDENIQRYQVMASQLGQSARSVPGIMFCATMQTGFDAVHSPVLIRQAIDECRGYIVRHGGLEGFQGNKDDSFKLKLPFVGEVDNEEGDNLVVITLTLAALDAFNPCAFFVLIFLLSMMLHTHKRGRMFLVGGVFVFISGLMYFLFMSAWLNIFNLIGQFGIITLLAGIVALVIGALNIKDYFWFKKGVSLTLTDSSRHQLFAKMRAMLSMESLAGVLLATAGLAAFANLYEFFCTAGFPMVYTRILTLNDLPDWQYYGYLLFYNLVYIVPLLIIVMAFSWTMNITKLQETQGRALKLVSGMMMLALGVILVFMPGALQDITITLGVIAIALLVSVVIVSFNRNRLK